MESIDLFVMFTSWIFLLGLGYYLITNLQWYNYQIKRVIFYHHKWKWHFYFFILPLIVFFGISQYPLLYGLVYVYIIALFIWSQKLSKPLVFTGRVWRFFGIYIGFILFSEMLGTGLLDVNEYLHNFFYILALVFTLILSNILEKVLLNRYAAVAKDKLGLIPNLQVILITGSYGKTSLKNFLLQCLVEDFRVYATPRSVNTFAGIVADINQNLSLLTDIYIVEAGAREEGDIKVICDLVQPKIAIIGKIGEAHIEYFKTLDTIYKTKYEVLQCPSLQKAYVYKDNRSPDFMGKVFYFPKNVSHIVADLDGVSFDMVLGDKNYSFSAQVLGAFNVANLSAAISVAYDLGINGDKLVKLVAKIKPVEHRLAKIKVNGKIILDDSYNGNLDGMLEALRLVSLHDGRRIIVTPGLIESSREANETLAKAIDDICNMAIITGELNTKLLRENIKNTQKIVLNDKENMEEILKGSTRDGDIILFANDAPSYI